MGGGGGCADGDGDWAVLPSPPLSDVTVALVGKISIGKNAIANCILGTHAFAPEFAYVSVTETCQKSSATFHDGCGATRTVNVIDTPGLLFDMEISTEDSRKEIIKCIEMIKDGIHAMIMVFSATSLFSCEEQNIEMIKLCQDRVVLFDNMTDNIECREMQRRKLLAAVDFVISSNGGKAFFYQMLPHIQEAKDGQHEISVHGCSAERIYEQPTRITKKVDENLNCMEVEIRRLRKSLRLRKLDEKKMSQQKEEINKLSGELEKARREELSRQEKEIRRLREKLAKSRKQHDNVKQEITNAEMLRRLVEVKVNEQNEEMTKLREELDKARQEEMSCKEEIQRLKESLKKSEKEHDNVKQELKNSECLRKLDEEKMNEQKEEINKFIALAC
ncbi:hypothetical protein CFC21_090725 [Triticum aestivum]|uniref:AIG1-type G domain-containing protein n=2 Tax=Triticum aestivum TaxID=4565 RepID=A0A9R1LEV2_WHEAT|nr:hypothetical protein CFC21_090725 [Triticum aestivum]